MKNTYIKPACTLVHINLHGSVLENEAIGGQSKNPISKDVDPSDVDWSAKSHDFSDDEEDTWGNVWK